jgi:hypothetical protein
MISKNELTKKLLVQLNLPTDEKTFRKYKTRWWMNSRTTNEKSFRLTEEGFGTLSEKLEISSYEISLLEDTEWTTQLILHLDKMLETPYFIQKNSLIVFREKTAVELILFGGNLQKYFVSKIKSQKNNTESS